MASSRQTTRTQRKHPRTRTVMVTCKVRTLRMHKARGSNPPSLHKRPRVRPKIRISPVLLRIKRQPKESLGVRSQQMTSKTYKKEGRCFTCHTKGHMKQDRPSQKRIAVRRSPQILPQLMLLLDGFPTRSQRGLVLHLRSKLSRRVASIHAPHRRVGRAVCAPPLVEVSEGEVSSQLLKAKGHLNHYPVTVLFDCGST